MTAENWGAERPKKAEHGALERSAPRERGRRAAVGVGEG